jgi:hypothetical protein
LQLLFGVCHADEARFELRGREVDVVVQHVAEESTETLRITALDVVKVPHRPRRKENSR